MSPSSRVPIVSGASRGIGRAIASRLAAVFAAFEEAGACTREFVMND
jgi:NAD(P)-dependent dehydrogenase (short-subunit alcohol dehydrogenase family)